MSLGDCTAGDTPTRSVGEEWLSVPRSRFGLVCKAPPDFQQQSNDLFHVGGCGAPVDETEAQSNSTAKPCRGDERLPRGSQLVNDRKVEAVDIFLAEQQLSFS